MNVALFNALADAHNFFLEDEQCEANIRAHQENIEKLRAKWDYEPTFQEPKMQWGSFFFALCVFFPVAIILLLSHMSEVKKAKAEFEKNVASKFNKAAYQQDIRDKIEAEQRSIAELQARRQENRRLNGKSVLFLPKWLQDAGTSAMKSLIFYVEKELSNTLENAVQRYERELHARAKEAEAELQREIDRQRQDQYHREQMEQYEKIRQGQRDLQEEINKARKGSGGWY